MEFKHIPVLLEQCLNGLNIKPGGVYLDGTAGGAGHSYEIAKRLQGGELFCFDKDPDAIAAASERLLEFTNVHVIQGDFKDASSLLAGKAEALDGALLDLGVSSFQLDSAQRGFSHSAEGALDMRMAKQGLSAADIVNTYELHELADLIRKYGEEKYAGPIARKIVEARASHPIHTTTELSNIVASALPAAERRKNRHPAKKTFMALRIAVNDEFETLRQGLQSIFAMLRAGGRFCVITFHSAEDRIVKQYFQSLFVACTCPKDYPVCVCGGKAKAKAITKKPLVANEWELEQNRRARSAKLRVIEKIEG